MLENFLKEFNEDDEEIEIRNIDLFEISKLEDCLNVSNSLKQEHAVIINVSNVDEILKQRVVDFVSGALYITDGHLEKIAENIYLFSPKSLVVSKA